MWKPECKICYNFYINYKLKLWKINKKSHLERRPVGVLSCPTLHQLQTQQEEKHCGQRHFFPISAGRRKAFLCPSNILANERQSRLSQGKTPVLGTPSLLQSTFVFRAFSTTPFLYKPVYPSPLLCRIAYGFPTAVPDCNPPLFPNKPIFADKIMANFIF